MIAAGGIADAAGAAALMLGAAGVQVGTAFLACEESNAAPGHKEALLAARAGDTLLTRAFSGRLARGLRNRLAEHLAREAPEPLPYPVQGDLLSPLRREALLPGTAPTSSRCGPARRRRRAAPPRPRGVRGARVRRGGAPGEFLGRCQPHGGRSWRERRRQPAERSSHRTSTVRTPCARASSWSARRRPRPRRASSGSAQVVVSGDRAYVVDCGDGVARQLVRADVPLSSLRHVFLTHHHSDHNANYGNLLSLAWTAGLATRVDTGARLRSSG